MVDTRRPGPYNPHIKSDLGPRTLGPENYRFPSSTYGLPSSTYGVEVFSHSRGKEVEKQYKSKSHLTYYTRV